MGRRTVCFWGAGNNLCININGNATGFLVSTLWTVYPHESVNLLISNLSVWDVNETLKMTSTQAMTTQ